MSPDTWSEDAKLFQPFALEQSLMHENASCLAVIALLKICSLPCRVIERANAEFMASNGRLSRLPLLVTGKTAIAEFEPIARLVAIAKQANSTERNDDNVDDADDADVDDEWTFICYVENTFTMAELYLSFMDEHIYQEITVPRMRGGFPWPLNIWRACKKRRDCLRLLRTYQWHDYTSEDVIEQLEKCCAVLTDRLMAAEAFFFGGEQPCALDAIVFAHIFTILTTNLPNQLLAHTVLKFTHLCAHCRQLEGEYFSNKIEQIDSKTRLLEMENI